jgi:hypothetical protein
LKKVKLHLGLYETVHEHKVYREIQAITKLEPTNIIRYYTCWIEELDDDELEMEQRFVDKFKHKLLQQQKTQNRRGDKSNKNKKKIKRKTLIRN